MCIYFFELPKTGHNISGGENCLLENIKYFSKKYRCIIITTDLAEKIFKERLGGNLKNVEYRTISTSDKEGNLNIFFSYVLRTVKAIFLVSRIKLNNQDVLICNSDFFPNSIPFFIFATTKKSVKIFYWWRVVAPSIFKGFEGQYTGRYQIPKINVVHYKINQLLYILLTKKKGIIITHAPAYYDYLSNKFAKNQIRVIKPYGGHEKVVFNCKEKIIDIIWMARFQKLKGLDNFINIVKKIQKDIPNIKVVILGSGNKKEINKLNEAILKNGLSKNIKCKGFVFGQQKSDFLSQSKIFAMTSYFESYGQVIVESMAHGLPIVSYDLPTFTVFSRGIIKVPILDDDSFSKEIIKLLSDKEKLQKFSEDAKEFSSGFSWDKTNSAIESIINC
ncbi:MAG: hypothetical protein CR972_02330 [Candidatus Moraniibacteriota bacterium]|nr:MAG: hypothetical protein CR972_02330 [Candidatus Moranbacteria bacterium]